jgi:hypothetical protein
LVGDGARYSRVAGGAPIDPLRPLLLPNEASGAPTEPLRPQAPLRTPLFALDAPSPSYVCVTGAVRAGASAGARAHIGENYGTVLLLLSLLPPIERRHCRSISAEYCRRPRDPGTYQGPLLPPSLERRHCRFVSAANYRFASACQSRRVALGRLSRPLCTGGGAGVGVGAGAGVGTTATSASEVGPRNSAGLAYTDSRVVKLK